MSVNMGDVRTRDARSSVHGLLLIAGDVCLVTMGGMRLQRR